MDEDLSALGERYLIDSVLRRYCEGIGDDCAQVGVRAGTLCITTDPVPEPAADVIAGDADPYWKGWLLVTINASDLAAAGASPLAFVAALEAPASIRQSAFERLLLGIADACKAEQLAYVGGNLREGARIAGVGTAIGMSCNEEAITRAGAEAGQLIVSIGSGGIFWRDAFRALEGEIDDSARENSPLFRPRSRSRAMIALHSRGLVRASIDNSDGLIPSLSQMARASGVRAEIELGRLTVIDAHGVQYRGSPIEPERLWFGWGDWNVLVAVRPEEFDRVVAAATEAGSQASQIGQFTGGPPGVDLVRGGQRIEAPRLESERFSNDSWFRTGIQEYVRRLLEAPLP